MRYSIQPRDRINLKGCGFLSFIKNVGKNIGENISKNLIGNNCQKPRDHTKLSATGAFKTSSKTAEGTDDLIRNKITNRITKVSKNAQESNTQTVANKHNKEIPKERFISPDYWWFNINLME